MQVRALAVEHSLKALLPYGVLRIPNREKRDRQCCSSSEEVLAQGGECDVHHHLNVGVRLTADDGPQPRHHGVKGYHHADLAPIQDVGHGHNRQW
jgi:hypothetical protein